MGRTQQKYQRVLMAFSCLILLPLSTVIQAQNYDSPGLGQKPVATHPQDFKPLGIRAGSFMLHPGVQLAAQFTDNVFYANKNKQDDTIFHVRPYITAQSTWSRHSLNVRLAADIARYKDFGFRDYEDYFLLINGKVDVKNQSFMTYGLDYLDLHEELNTRSAEQGVEPTRYNMVGGNLGYDHTFNRFSVAAQYRLIRLDFDNARGFDGEVIDNQDRDRDENSLRLRAGYQFKTDMQAYVAYVAQKVEFDEALDRNGLARSGDGYTVDGGVNFTMTGKLKGDLFVRYLDREYDDPSLPNTNGWTGGAGLQWTPTYLTTVSGSITGSIEDTTLQYSSGYLRTLYSLRVDHELLRFLQLSGFVAYADNDYQLIDGAPENARSYDEVFRAGIGVSWFINRALFLSASYDYEKLETNVPSDGYDVNRVWLTLGLER
jgi:hypothetical protein